MNGQGQGKQFFIEIWNLWTLSDIAYISFIPYKELNRVPAGFGRTPEHVECYDKNNISKRVTTNIPLDTAIFEIQPTGIDGVSIKVNIDDEGSITPLYFGENGDLDTIFINVDDPSIIGRVISKRNFKNEISEWATVHG